MCSSGRRAASGAQSRASCIMSTDYSKGNRMSISADLLKKEDLRSHLFGETWRTLIPEVFRDVPTYYDKGNAVASLGNCSRWSTTFATAIHRHLPHGAKILDVC